MKKIKKSLFILISILITGFVLYTLISTGLFRNIKSVSGTEIYKQIALNGAEDLAISYKDSFAIISATDRSVFPAQDQEHGDLFYIDLRNSTLRPISLTSNIDFPFAPHGISLYGKDSSYIIAAINHTSEGDKIELFSLEDKILRHNKTLSHSSMLSPNDLVLIGENSFYFTNDHGFQKGIGKFLEEYLGLAGGNVVLFHNEEYKVVANKIAYANGINYDASRSILYVASPRKFKVNVYDIKEDLSLKQQGSIMCGSGVDNLELDPEGSIWIGSHPNLLKFKSYSRNKSEMAPSEVLKVSYHSNEQYEVEKIYVNKGDEISGSSVAAPFGDLIFVGNVKDDKLLVLKHNN